MVELLFSSKVELDPFSPLCTVRAFVQKKHPEKQRFTDALEECLTIGVGVRVMLRRNLNVAEGLVNGSLGTVTNLKRVDGAVEFVEVLFDVKQEPVDIEKVYAKFEILPRVFISRKQFPICLAYAITIHKSQGLTLDKVLIDLGSQCFEDAVAYVALLQARCLDQVHMVHFEAHVIRCKASAAEEYNRLRSAYTDLPKLPAFNRLPSFYARVGPRNPMLSRMIEPVSKKKVVAKRRRNQQDASIPTDSLSEAVSCYANSIVQACLQISATARSFATESRNISSSLSSRTTSRTIISAFFDERMMQ